MGSLDSVGDVDIDPNGVFKYILIEIKKSGEKKTIVRGYKSGVEYHDDIFEQVSSQLEEQSIKLKCIGGGRIEHKSEEQTLFVYGHSIGFGKADHEKTVQLLKVQYPSYKITWSDDGY